MAEAARREARRQKILQRGTDRLAFITGERKSLPTGSESGVPSGLDDVRSVTRENEPSRGNAVAEQVEMQDLSRVTEHASVAQENDHAMVSAHTVDRSGQDFTAEPVKALQNEDGEFSSSNVISTEGGLQTAKPSSRGCFFSGKALGAAIEASRLPRVLLAIVMAITTVAAQSMNGGGVLENFFTRVQPPVVLFTSSIALVIALWFLESSKLLQNQKDPGVERANIDRVLKSSEMFLSIVLVAKQFVRALSGDLSVYLLVLVCSMSWCNNF